MALPVLKNHEDHGDLVVLVDKCLSGFGILKIKNRKTGRIELIHLEPLDKLDSVGYNEISDKIRDKIIKNLY